nr:T9SS type A sorting domain-containing protein [Prevotella sp.]
KIDKQNLTSGVYILKSFYDNGKITSMKFVKK